MVHRGLEDGTDHLRLQFRDVAQRGQRDEYGGDKIENTAASGARQMERGVRNLLKNRKKSAQPAGEPAPAEGGPTSNEPGYGQVWIKMREAGIGRSQEAANRSGAALASRQERTAVKTKDSFLQQQSPSAQTAIQGQREFAQEQGRALVRKRAGQTSPLGPRSSGTEMGRPMPRTVEGRAAPPKRVAGTVGRPGKPDARLAAGRAVKTAENSSRKTIKTARRTAKAARKAGTGAAAQSAMRREAIRDAGRAARGTRTAARTASAAVRAIGRTSGTVVKAAVTAAQAPFAIAAGGVVIFLIVVVVCLAGALAESPLGIFFSDDSGGTPEAATPSEAAAQINGELADQLAQLQEGGTYDRVEVQGQPPAWSDVLAVFAVRTAGAEDGSAVAVLDPERVELLREVFWDMTKITAAAEAVDIPARGNTPASTEEVLNITITSRMPDDMRVFYSFTEEQNEALDELLASADLLTGLVQDLNVTSRGARDLLLRLPADLDPERRAVVETACRLVGKVNYFWGGKSLTVGWNDAWGTLRQVTAAGSSTTGTYRPYGMDCSGFVDWVFYNVSGGTYVIGHGGGAAAQHTYCDPISWDEAMPGDLVFYPEDSHVGIVGGWDENGSLLIIQCSSSANNVVVSGTDGFAAAARPVYYEIWTHT